MAVNNKHFEDQRDICKQCFTFVTIIVYTNRMKFVTNCYVTQSPKPGIC